jgi:hypothetical protein
MNRRHIILGGATLATLGAGAAWLTTARMGSAADYADATRATRAALPVSADERPQHPTVAVRDCAGLDHDPTGFHQTDTRGRSR